MDQGSSPEQDPAAGSGNALAEAYAQVENENNRAALVGLTSDERTDIVRLLPRPGPGGKAVGRLILLDTDGLPRTDIA